LKKVRRREEEGPRPTGRKEKRRLERVLKGKSKSVTMS